MQAFIKQHEYIEVKLKTHPHRNQPNPINLWFTKQTVIKKIKHAKLQKKKKKSNMQEWKLNKIITTFQPPSSSPNP